MSTVDAMLDYLRAGGRLTPLTALEKFQCLSLSQRMGDLKRAGHPIVAEMVTMENGKRVAEYRMERHHAHA